MNKPTDFPVISQLLLEADLEANGAGINKEALRKVLALSEADFTESYDNADDAMAALIEYCDKLPK